MIIGGFKHELQHSIAIDETLLRGFTIPITYKGGSSIFFDHLNVLICYVRHVSHLCYVLPQQAIEAHVGPSPPTGKGTGKVSRVAQRCINPGVLTKLFGVAIGQGLDPSLNGLRASMIALNQSRVSPPHTQKLSHSPSPSSEAGPTTMIART